MELNNPWVSLLLLWLWAFGITYVAEPLAIWIGQRFRILDVPDGKRKFHEKPTPRTGGIVFFFSLILGPLLFWWGVRRVEVISLAAFILFLAMVLDDMRGLSPYVKLIVQLWVAFIVVLWGGVRFFAIHLEPWFSWELPLWLSLVFSVVWIVAFTNAINFIDGLDGLAGGVVTITGLAFSIFAIYRGYVLVGLLMALVSGTAAGFLPFNFPNAKVFMGDCGSQLFGFYIGVLTLWGGLKTIGGLVFLIYLLIFVIPLSDLVWSALIRLLKGENPMKADNRHIHDTLIKKGLSAKTVVWLAYITSAVISFGAVLIFMKMGGR